MILWHMVTNYVPGCLAANKFQVCAVQPRRFEVNYTPQAHTSADGSYGYLGHICGGEPSRDVAVAT